MSENVPVVILAGGKGTRMRDFSARIPKAIVPIGKMAVIEHVMRIYSHHGFNDFVITLGYKGDSIKQYFQREESEKEIFKGQQIVFVESGGRDDPYFNYARNCNIGLRYALRYKPRWIVLSNDDMYKIDEIQNLKKELGKLNRGGPQILFSADSEVLLTKDSILSRLFYLVNKSYWRYYKLTKKFKVKYFTLSFDYNSFSSKFKKVYLNLTRKKIERFNLMGAFSVFRGDLKLLDKLFDETYINGVEDVDLSLLIKKEYRYAKLKYQCGSIGKGALGGGNARSLRSLIGEAYLNYKLNKMELIVQDQY